MLYVNGCSRITTAGLVMIAMKCTELKSIYLENCLEISAEHCASLEDLFPIISWITSEDDEDESEDEDTDTDED